MKARKEELSNHSLRSLSPKQQVFGDITQTKQVSIWGNDWDVGLPRLLKYQNEFFKKQKKEQILWGTSKTLFEFWEIGVGGQIRNKPLAHIYKPLFLTSECVDKNFKYPMSTITLKSTCSKLWKATLAMNAGQMLLHSLYKSITKYKKMLESSRLYVSWSKYIFSGFLRNLKNLWEIRIVTKANIIQTTSLKNKEHDL